jgi:hypothetical protein
MLGLQWLQVRKILLKWFFQLCRQPSVHLVSTAAPISIIVRFLDKVLEAIQAVEIQAFAEPFDSSNGTANNTTSYVIFYL